MREGERLTSVRRIIYQFIREIKTLTLPSQLHAIIFFYANTREWINTNFFFLWLDTESIERNADIYEWARSEDE